jgi:putative flippase GtrA
VTALIFRTTASLRWLPSLAAIVPNGTVQQRARARRPHLPQRLGGNATREWHFKDRHIPGECDPTKVLTILAVLQRRFVVGGVALGLMSSLKMLPLVGVLAFLILPIGWAQKARAVAASLLAFSAIQLVNIMISGSYGASFLKQLLGRIPNQGSPYMQQNGVHRLLRHIGHRWFCLNLMQLTFELSQATATVVAIIGNFTLNNWLTYHDRRKFVRGLLSFALICGFGAVANVGIASLLFTQHHAVWWVAGIAGAAMSAVWNYAVTSTLTWRE